MWIFLLIALITLTGFLAIWGSRLIHLRRGETLVYYDYHVLPIVRAKLSDLYGQYLHGRVLLLLGGARRYLFAVLKVVFLSFKGATTRIEYRFLALMNAIRGRGTIRGREGVPPSAFLGELKARREEVRSEFSRSA